MELHEAKMGMDPVNLATPELWAIMLEKQRSDSGSFPGLPLTWGWGGVGGRAPFTTTCPQQAWLSPSLLVHQAPKPCFPFPPSQGQHRATHLERTMLIVTGGTSCLRLGE